MYVYMYKKEEIREETEEYVLLICFLRMPKSQKTGKGPDQSTLEAVYFGQKTTTPSGVSLLYVLDFIGMCKYCSVFFIIR